MKKLIFAVVMLGLLSLLGLGVYQELSARAAADQDSRGRRGGPAQTEKREKSLAILGQLLPDQHRFRRITYENAARLLGLQPSRV